jgi:hypothetical protein
LIHYIRYQLKLWLGKQGYVCHLISWPPTVSTFHTEESLKCKVHIPSNCRKFHKTRPHRKVSTRPNWLHWLISRHPPSNVLTGSAYMMKHRDLRGSLCFYTSKCTQSPIFDHILKWRTTLNALKKICTAQIYSGDLLSPKNRVSFYFNHIWIKYVQMN